MHTNTRIFQNSIPASWKYGSAKMSCKVLLVCPDTVQKTQPSSSIKQNKC
jgi:hypothetical protein